MPLAPNSKLGPYEVISPLGAGGMGEVYRASDTRLGREVAIKILPADFTKDPDRLRRFQQEAQATASLNHPNILAVFDAGQQGGVPYVVSELLEGETLRSRMQSGIMPVRKSIAIAIQIAQGLAAAHGKGIIHRDLKPENLFLMNDGRVKILDFGLAKLTQTKKSSDAFAATASQGTTYLLGSDDSDSTASGVVMGTAGYMSPEQVRGQELDARTDIFAFGCVLFEMLCGQRAFKRDTAPETMTAILKDDPPDLTELNRNVPPALERIVRHCLEKNPEQRFHSASDIAFDLESLSSVSGSTAANVRRTQRLRPWMRAGAGIAIIVFLVFAYSGIRNSRWGDRGITVTDVKQLTFRRGTVYQAAFAPGGNEVVYSAAWDGNQEEVFTTSAMSPESRGLDLKDTGLLAVSRKGELAIKLHPRLIDYSFARFGTLATVPLTGGSPRPLLDNVESADWAPDAKQLAVIQLSNGEYTVQFPIGNILYRSSSWLSHLRVSPDGRTIAVLQHPIDGDEGAVTILDTTGHTRELSRGWQSLQGLAWSRDGKEVWFTGTRTGGNRALYAVDTEGKERLIAKVPGVLTISDISPQGEVLMHHDFQRSTVIVKTPAEKQERDLSWLDSGHPIGLSADGKKLLLVEDGEGGGEHYTTYLRPTDGAAAIRLGEGTACDLSSDGKLAFSHMNGQPGRLLLLPEIGTPSEIAVGAIDPDCGLFIPETHKILFLGAEPGHKWRIFELDLDKPDRPHPVSAEGVAPHSEFQTDGRSIALVDENGKGQWIPLEGGSPQPIKGLQEKDSIIGMGRDGRTIFVSSMGSVPVKVIRLDTWNGNRILWKEVGPVDKAGVETVNAIYIYDDGDAYTYSYYRFLSELYIFEGLH